MGKISDIWVRLGLKKDDFDKGMDDAAKKTEGVGGAFSKMKTAALAVWAAIGTAAVKFAQDLIASTNRMGDAWAVFTSQSKAAWDTFLSAVSSWDFNNFFDRMSQATAAAAELAKALDSEFEADASIRLQRAAMAKENAALKVLWQDQTKSYDERIKAAQQYLDNVTPIYDQILAQAKRMEDAHLHDWLSGVGLSDTEQVRKDLRTFLVEIGKPQNAGMLDTLTTLSKVTGQLEDAKKGSATEKALTQRVAYLREQLSEQFSMYETDLLAMFDAYTKMSGDKDMAPLIQAMERAGWADAQKNIDTAEVQSIMSGLVMQQTAEAIKAATEAAANSPEALLKSAVDDIIANIDKDLEALEDIEIELPEIDTTALDAGEERLKQFVDEWRKEQEKLAQYNQMIEDSIITSMSNGLQAITDMMFGLEGADMRGVLAAFIAPFGDMMKNLGALIMEGGIAASALKKLIKQPEVAIAAGAALMALGSMVSSGVQKMVSTGSGSGSVATTGASGAETETIKTELTVYVEGKISGKDIILAGNNTRNSWRR